KRRAAARGEGRAASPGRAEREPPGGPSAGRVDLPWRGGVLRRVVIDCCDCGDEPARVRGDREAGEPREGDVLVQVMEWGSHSPCLPRALSPAPVGAPARDRSAPLLFALARSVLVRVLVGELLEHRVVGLEVGLPVAGRCPIAPPSYPFLRLRPHHCQGDRESEAGELPDTPRELSGDALVQGGIDSPGEAELAEERRTDEALHRDD